MTSPTTTVSYTVLASITQKPLTPTSTKIVLPTKLVLTAPTVSTIEYLLKALPEPSKIILTQKIFLKRRQNNLTSFTSFQFSWPSPHKGVPFLHPFLSYLKLSLDVLDTLACIHHQMVDVCIPSHQYQG